MQSVTCEGAWLRATSERRVATGCMLRRTRTSYRLVAMDQGGKGDAARYAHQEEDVLTKVLLTVRLITTLSTTK